MKTRERARKPARHGQKPAARPGKLSESTEPEGHALWTGTISFSLVAIPVKLVSALGPGWGFHMLHAADHSPLRRKMICPRDEKEISPEDTIRGYETAPGKYLEITDRELESVSVERSRSIEISEFIELKEVDPIYYDRPYFLVPTKGGEKSYRLLAEAMRLSGKAGLAKFVLNEREYLVIVRNRDGALSLHTLHYSEDIIPEERPERRAKGAESRKKEAIIKCIKEMTSGFRPEKYADERKSRLLELIRKKTQAKAVVEAPETEEEPAEEVSDLMAALEESMRQTGAGKSR